jgi:ketosteroid isomerase-like protein
MIELYGGRCGDGFSRAVADSKGDFQAVTTGDGSFCSAVLAKDGEWRNEKASQNWANKPQYPEGRASP